MKKYRVHPSLVHNAFYLLHLDTFVESYVHYFINLKNRHWWKHDDRILDLNEIISIEVFFKIT